MKVTLTLDEVKAIVLKHIAQQFPRTKLNTVELQNGYSYSSEFCTLTHEVPETVKADEVEA